MPWYHNGDACRYLYIAILTLVGAKNYVYNNAMWKDLLTSYGGDTIIYDNSGNPTSYLGDTLTWTGNQLTQHVHGQSTISYSYNESGLRTKKNISGGTETTCIGKYGVLCAMKIDTTLCIKLTRLVLRNYMDLINRKERKTHGTL